MIGCIFLQKNLLKTELLKIQNNSKSIILKS